MNFRQNQKPPRVEPEAPAILNMKQLAEAVDREREEIESSARNYAPPAIRNSKPEETAIVQVKSFSDLVTKELDDTIAAAEAEIASLKAECQAVRDVYVRHTNRITTEIKRLREGVRMSMETIKTCHEQILKLDEPLTPELPQRESKAISTP
jgi:uncharacterized small protein (DUF1192 family)